MKLSIIIVNYNVQYFLEQCLNSVFKALEDIDSEVFVVDNNSPDNSVTMVQKKFSGVHLIANKENVGFSKANNQAIEIAKGEYVLLLNPDTIVEEDTFQKCIEFMDQHPEAGGLGVKMIDGNGVFLPESKRGLPTPAVSFYKISGLSLLFPKSKRFSKYHLGYLNEDDTNEIEILSGAFMWMRKSVIDKTGYLDETFFMYGEDIDLSYRILKAGFKNYYFPKAKIIHYKGESTKKGSINYVFVFYNAMIIFAKKHFTNKAKTFSFFINIAIYLRAFMAIVIRFIKKLSLPIIDVVLILITLTLLNYLKPYLGFPNQIHLSNNYGLLNVGTVILSFLAGLTITRSYSKLISIRKTIFGLVIGSILLYGINFIFPESVSFSNKYLISIVIGVLILVPLNRFFLHYFNKLKLKVENNKNIILVGNKENSDQLKKFIDSKQKLQEILLVKENDSMTIDELKSYTGKFYQLEDLVDIYNCNEIIFSSKDIKYKDIIAKMESIKSKYIDYKISLNNDLMISSQMTEK